MRRGFSFLSVFVRKHSSWLSTALFRLSFILICNNTKKINTYECIIPVYCIIYRLVQAYINKYGLGVELSSLEAQASAVQ